jgi:hypothetical protein
METAIEYMRGELHERSIKRNKYFKREGTVRCVFCGDSKKNRKDEHLYIKLTPDGEAAPFSYNCKLCGRTGYTFSEELIRLLHIENTELIEYIRKNRNNKSSNINHHNDNYIAKKLNSNIIYDTDIINKKKEYMMNRLNYNDIIDNPNNYKIIYDLRSFFISNHLKPNHDYNNVKALLSLMHDCCIGFISLDNTHIIFRDITGKLERYTQYVIYPSSYLESKETTGMYMVPTIIDKMKPNLTLIMAEGTFDILRIYTDLYRNKADNSHVFVSVANSYGYRPCIMKLMKYGLLFNNIIIYSDSDVKLNVYKTTIKPFIPGTSITVYYNTLYKDIGDITKPLNLTYSIL